MDIKNKGINKGLHEKTNEDNEKKTLFVMKKLKVIKKVKILVASVLFCAMGYVGYTAYEKMTVSEAEKFMQVNVEALTRGESGGTDYTCESKIGDGDRKTFFCAACDWVKGDPTWDSVTKSCTK